MLLPPHDSRSHGSWRISLLLASLSLLLPPAHGASAATADDVRDLAIGDPARRDQVMELDVDTIVDTRSGDRLAPAELARRLEPVDILFIGEEHTNMEVHRAQLRTIAALAEAGRDVMVGLEMFPSTEQAALDLWTDGIWTERGFVQEAHWYRHWGYHWGYYRDIFLFARNHRLRMVALNAPRDVVSAVRELGLDGLSADERAHLPPRVDTDSDEHFTLFKAYFDEDDPIHSALSEEDWRSMFASQCTWDATMGYNAVRAFEARAATSDRGGRPIMVVLIGSGHVAYGLGIERQARLWFDGVTATLIPLPIAAGEPGRVRASHADYLWGLPAERHPRFPTLGASVRDSERGLAVLFVDETSPAGRAGVHAGDLLLSINGEPLPDREALNRSMAQMGWGDVVRLQLYRDGEPLDLAVPLQRSSE